MIHHFNYVNTKSRWRWR